MKFVAEEIEGEVVVSNNKGLLVSEYSVQWSLENFNMLSEQQQKSPFCPFCETAEHSPQHCNSVTDIDACIQNLKATNKCFLLLTVVTPKTISIVKINTAVPNVRKDTRYQYF
ncbi:hypothetical protein NPIL_519141 [Nephila pilipes]|uniref:Uncharacterized protein n=1 Tax=Nephila pilipes TaxID=299642 RepID=A0A8X6NTJ0_NEPPI|nr:hypothetical protein NPIL_519141 [Nephila pilipes]